MYGKYRNPPSKPSASFVPPSSVAARKTTVSLIKQSSLKGAPRKPAAPALASTAGTSTGLSIAREDAIALASTSGKDLFGLGGAGGAFGGAGGFWMPDLSVAPQPDPKPEPKAQAPPLRAPAPTLGLGAKAGGAEAVPEVFDGYHVWRQFHSRTKNVPFWHCKETGATRWERPTVGAVQGADKVPEVREEAGENDDLLDGEVDEAANRRAFLAALYEWRNGSKPPAEEGKGKENESGARDPIRERQERIRRVMPDKPAAAPKQRTPSTSNVSTLKSASRAKQAVSLHSAAGNGEADVVKDMLQAGADVLSKDRLGLSAMHYAASGGHVAAIEALVRAGGDANARDNDEDTPLHSATKNGHASAVRRLVELGADATLTNARGNTAARLAGMFGKREIEGILEAGEIKLDTRHGSADASPLKAAARPSPQAHASPQKAQQEAAKDSPHKSAQGSSCSPQKHPSEAERREGDQDGADFGCGCDLDGEGETTGGRVFEVRKGWTSAAKHGDAQGVSCGPDEEGSEEGSEEYDALAVQDNDSEDARAHARALLEALRGMAKKEVEERWSRPNTARSSRSAHGTPQKCARAGADEQVEGEAGAAAPEGSDAAQHTPVIQKVLARIDQLDLDDERSGDISRDDDADDHQGPDSAQELDSGDEALELPR